ncbi:putative oxidoreductase YhdF [Candidatus Protochlamydia amoebophila]|uniref:SDR family oxidoreductase n=1 Tax=Candidatus Protochlamydia amoebophila TaxID=362787 RepID=UPI001BC95F53|nr:SDR family oxidoreductase [Candidatus Protochlamydia amoebophila]MBS4162778.1 putative oxidoreductase YhdF [Candidatus Protochlamydia amoebophila]
MIEKQKEKTFPPQKQTPPGEQFKMYPLPKDEKKGLKGSGKLFNQVAIITGGDSGIGRAVAISFAKEGADIVVVYLNEHKDAEETKKLVEEKGRKCLLIAGDIGQNSFCQSVIKETIQAFGKLNILVNNAAEQHPQDSIEDITEDQLEKTFRTNVYSLFFMTKAALPYLEEVKGTIINTTSVTAYKGKKTLIDYSATKGAIVAFTRSLSLSLVEKGIRVNGVAPGPIWTPLITSTFPEEKVSVFGSNVPMKRAGQPDEVAPCYVFLASQDSSYISGQILHPNGGEIING